jgi:Protein of unknown function (DUF1153)
MNTPVTRADLLAPVERWTVLAKFWLCDGIRRGTITFDDAKAVHDVSDIELQRWYQLYESDGVDGLRRINKTRWHQAARRIVP